MRLTPNQESVSTEGTKAVAPTLLDVGTMVGSGAESVEVSVASQATSPFKETAANVLAVADSVGCGFTDSSQSSIVPSSV